MARRQLTSGSAGVILSKFSNFVFVRQLWTDAWEYLPYLFAQTVTVASGGALSSATLSYHFGDLKDNDVNDFARKLPEELAGYYVKIQFAEDGKKRWTPFVGRITTDSRDLHVRQSHPQGVQVLSAFGMEILLDRLVPTDAWVYDDNGLRQVSQMPPMNTPALGGRGIEGNRTATPPPGRTTHVYGDGGEWTHLDFVTMLLAEYTPDGITFGLAGDTSGLDYIKSAWRPNGSLRSMLNHLISFRRGYSFTIRIGANDEPVVHVFSAFNGRIAEFSSDPEGASIVANSEQIHLDLSDLPSESNVTVLRTDAEQMDEIVVEGELMKCCCTLDYRQGHLDKGWSTQDETDYGAITQTDATERDKARRADKFEHVFQRFEVADDWDGTVGDVDSETVVVTGDWPNEVWTFLEDEKSFAIPVLNNDATIDITQGSFLWKKHKVFSRNLPFIKQGDDLDSQNNLARPFVIARMRRRDSTPHLVWENDAADGDYWHMLDMPMSSISSDAELDLTPSARLKMLDKVPGFAVGYGIPHIMSLKGEVADIIGASNQIGLIDWQDVAATVMFETDTRARVTGRRIGAEDLTDPRRLVIAVPGAEMWYVAPNTVVGVNAGTAEKHAGGLVRDDSARLRLIFMLAGSWYSEQRQAVEIEANGLIPLAPVGSYLIDVTTTSDTEQIGTVVTSITWQAGSQLPTTTIQTGFSELDFGGVFNFPGLSSARDVAREIITLQQDVRSLRGHVDNLPVRDGSGGDGGSGGLGTGFPHAHVSTAIGFNPIGGSF